MDSIEKISCFCLVACDQSYKDHIAKGTLLGEFADSELADVYPNTMPTSFNSYVNDGVHSWQVYDRVDDPITGFGATIYQRLSADGNVDFMVAMQGTRGVKAQDWNGNLGLALDKWKSESGGQKLLADYLRPLLIGKQITGDIYFTGQSLGGALAEYAAYDFRSLANDLQRTNGLSEFSNNRISLMTFNGLGGVGGLQEMQKEIGQAFNPNQLTGSTTRHYYITGDIVNRLGEGTGDMAGQNHLNSQGRGQGNEYRLDFYAYNLDGSVAN